MRALTKPQLTTGTDGRQTNGSPRLRLPGSCSSPRAVPSPSDCVFRTRAPRQLRSASNFANAAELIGVVIAWQQQLGHLIEGVAPRFPCALGAFKDTNIMTEPLSGHVSGAAGADVVNVIGDRRDVAVLPRQMSAGAWVVASVATGRLTVSCLPRARFAGGGYPSGRSVPHFVASRNDAGRAVMELGGVTQQCWAFS